MCLIANKGYYYTPHFVDSFQNETIEDTAYLNKYRTRHDPTNIADTSYAIVQLGMQDVVTHGTARNAMIPGVEVCGKTGTAQNPHGKNHSLFVAFAPRTDPKIAIAVVVENSGYGGTWASPIASLMMEKYLNDTISTKRQHEVERISKADLIPAAIKHWYYVRDSLKQARLLKVSKEVSVDTIIEAPVVSRKITFDPEAEPNRKDSGDAITPKDSLLLPDNKRNRKDSIRI
jgi:penicillin-binding protein 2